MIGARSLLLAGLLFRAAAPLAGQVHQSRAPTVAQVRAEYLQSVLEGINETIVEFRAAVERDDAGALVKVFQDGALYSPGDGASHYGREAIREGFAGRLARLGPVLLTRVDFTASGGLAYQFGRYFYGPGGGDAGGESGTYVLVLAQVGRGWKIRSYVERPAGS